MAIVNRCGSMGTREDVTIVEKILQSMTPTFNFVVCSIEESHDIDELSIDELQSSLLVHERDRGRGRSRGGGRGNYDREINTNTNVNTTDFKEEDKVAITQLHINQGQQTSPMWSATDVIEKEEEVSLLMACHANQGTHPNLWYIDTGCSNHMCGDKSSLSWAKEVYEFTPKKNLIRLFLMSFLFQI
ncbi:hypothetical protein AAG906_016907 [Vitis piasezkii]